LEIPDRIPHTGIGDQGHPPHAFKRVRFAKQPDTTHAPQLKLQQKSTPRKQYIRKKVSFSICAIRAKVNSSISCIMMSNTLYKGGLLSGISYFFKIGLPLCPDNGSLLIPLYFGSIRFIPVFIVALSGTLFIAVLRPRHETGGAFGYVKSVNAHRRFFSVSLAFESSSSSSPRTRHSSTYSYIKNTWYQTMTSQYIQWIFYNSAMLRKRR
jgi:hypothetical protein